MVKSVVNRNGGKMEAKHQRYEFVPTNNIRESSGRRWEIVGSLLVPKRLTGGVGCLSPGEIKPNRELARGKVELTGARPGAPGAPAGAPAATIRIDLCGRARRAHLAARGPGGLGGVNEFTDDVNEFTGFTGRCQARLRACHSTMEHRGLAFKRPRASERGLQAHDD